MFSKLVLTTAAISTTNALNLRLTSRQVEETCTYNLQRMKSPRATSDWNKYKDSSTPYDDPEFPANQSSLFWDKYHWEETMPRDYTKNVVGWKRPEELYPNETPSLWGKKGVQPNGTSQGDLGDCWFLAAASALAEWPERMQHIFTNKEYSKSGIFQVTFWHMAKPVKVVVDDRLPV